MHYYYGNYYRRAFIQFCSGKYLGFAKLSIRKMAFREKVFGKFTFGKFVFGNIAFRESGLRKNGSGNQIGLMRRGEIDVSSIPKFLKNESLTADFSETQQVDELRLKIVFLNFLTGSVLLRGN